MPLPSSNRPLAAVDCAFLQRALRLAARGRFGTSPNPQVGAVVVTAGGEVVGEGWHRQLGGPHAEVEALAVAGARARGATLFVTLEPCSHQGRTGPCCEAVIAAGVRRVVVCHRDPNPQVAGRGLRRIAAAGIEVDCGYLVEQAVRLNWRFLVAMTMGRPAVSLKWAMSLDGKIATAGGDSQWISSAAGRRWGMEQREDHDAILVGSGTALADDPSLNRRLKKTLGANLRLVLDRRLRLPPTARMLSIEGPVLVYTERSDAAAVAALSDRGAEVQYLDRLTPASVLADLGRRGVQSLLVEGGSEITAAFVAAGLYDRVGVDCAPLLIAGVSAPGPVGGAGFEPLAAAPRLDGMRARRRGEDLIIEGFRAGCLADLCLSVAG